MPHGLPFRQLTPDNVVVFKGWLLCAIVLVLASRAGSQEPAGKNFEKELDRAVQLLGEFKDEEAAAVLRGLLSKHPPDELAAKAHVYLAITWMNVDDVKDAKHEMQLALSLNGLIELPKGVSPKARILFAQAQREAEQGQGLPPPVEHPKPAAVVARPPATAPVLAPVPLVPAEPSAAMVDAYGEKEKPPGSSHTLGIVLGAVGVAVGIVAIVGAVEVAQFQSASSQVESNLLSEAPAGQTYQNLVSQQQSALTWRAVGFTCAGVAVAARKAAGLTW